MNEELNTYLATHRIEIQRFFQRAHQWKYGISITCKHDSDVYKREGHVPIYVLEYLEHLKK